MNHRPFLRASVFVLLLFSVSLYSCKNKQENDQEAESNTQETEVSQIETEQGNLEAILESKEKSSFSQTNNTLRPKTKTSSFSDESETFSAADSAAFFARFSPETQIFKINNDEDQDFFCEQGTYINIKAESFVFADGTPVTSEVTLEIKEFYDKATVLLAGLGTNTRNGFLESGGMLHLAATAEGKEVRLNKDIEVQMPSYLTRTRSKNGMTVYFADDRSAEANSSASPPSRWRTNGRSISLRGIPSVHTFYKTKFLFEKDDINIDEQNKYDCECADVKLVSEKIDALSSEVQVSKKLDYTSAFRTIKPKEDVKKTDYPALRYKFYDKDTAVHRDYSITLKKFYPNQEKDPRFIYDTIQVAFEISKKGYGKVIEELKVTRHALNKTNITRSIKSASGLRLSATISDGGICKNEKTGFYIRSQELWYSLLEEGENEFRKWRSTQKKNEEDYAISYKKRKKPIFIWTGVVRTTKKSFVEEYKITHHSKYYLRYKDEERQRKYDAYRQARIKQYEKFLAQNPEKLSGRGLDAYVFSTRNLGWINCDRFYNVPKNKRTNLFVNSTTPVRIIFKDVNSVMEGDSNATQNRFKNIPKGERITIFGVRKKGDKILMALKQTRVSPRPVDLEYKEVTFQEMKEALASL